MVFTEEEAKNIWCPMVRHTSDTGGPFNRGENNNPLNKNSGLYSCNCIGSKCAGWRWKNKKTNFPAKGYCCFSGPVEIDDPFKKQA